jgi:hypothetical protein
MSGANVCDRNFPHAGIPVNHTCKFQELFKATTYFFPLRIAQLLDPEF